jgi:hypothetical protein
MTKARYFEMCETLGTEPLEDEIPVEYGDLSPEIQYALSIYSKLKDEWDTFNGNYMGKSYNGIADIFKILEVPKEDARQMFDLIDIIDRHRSKMIQDSKPKK